MEIKGIRTLFLISSRKRAVNLRGSHLHAVRLFPSLLSSASLMVHMGLLHLRFSSNTAGVAGIRTSYTYVDE